MLSDSDNVLPTMTICRQTHYKRCLRHQVLQKKQHLSLILTYFCEIFSDRLDCAAARPSCNKKLR